MGHSAGNVDPTCIYIFFLSFCLYLPVALNETLKEEIQQLKVMTGQGIVPKPGPVMNFPASFGTNQQFYLQNHAMNALLTAQQFQQLKIQSQKQQQFYQFQQQQMGEFDTRVSSSSFQSHKDDASDPNNP